MIDFIKELFHDHLDHVLQQEPVPDDDEEMNWRLFFAHSQDMQGFAADIFVGGPNERKHPTNPLYVGLRERWQLSSYQLINDLAEVWRNPSSQELLKQLTDPRQQGNGFDEGLHVLRSASTYGAAVFAECLSELSGPRIARKTNKMIRAYVQNSDLLTRHGGSFRRYLENDSSMRSFPSTVTPSIEAVWRKRIQRDFFNVGPAIANYLISDWLLWLWKEGRIEWFESYKADSVHEAYVQSGMLQNSACHDFVAFCSTLRIPSGNGALSGKQCPPRVLNACLWQKGNQSSGNQQTPVGRGQASDESGSAHRDNTYPQSSTAMIDGVTKFKDDDAGYRQWHATHTNGYVLNTDRNPRPSYLKLHRVTCPSIVGPIDKGQNLTHAYIKFCSGTRNPLVRWCRETFGIEPEAHCSCLSRV